MPKTANLVTGATRVIFMVGSPIAQTQSPALFNALFADRRADDVMVPVEVSPATLPGFVAMVRDASNCAGLVATFPHKRALLSLVDEASETAVALGSVNVVRREADGRLRADMADGPGFWHAVAARRIDPAGSAMALAGAGAAGTAIAYEFARRGGRRLALWTRDEDEVEPLRRVLTPFETTVEIGMPASLAPFDIAVNATPIGMPHSPGTAFDAALLESLPSHALVADAVTEPVETRLLEQARRLGLRTMEGREMTAGQFRHLLKWLDYPE